ncbi:MAG: MraY family glycosyltransferase [Bacteroidota bacterium]
MQSVLLLLGTVGFSFLLNKILLRFSKNFGVDSRQTQQNWVRWSTAAKPTTGGISFFITFLLGMLVLLIVRPEQTATSSPYLALLLSATMAFLVGFADDAYGTHPSLKFLGQMMCGAILLYFGIRIHFFEMVNPNLWFMDYALTMFWVVGIMNSLNMLDNMDGVTTTIATSIAMVGLIMITSLEGLSNIFYAVIAVIGGFVGFLFWNWKPAKIYMGDTGSMFVGMILAFVGIEYFWNIPASPDNISHIRKGLIPLMVFLVPIMDTSFVTFARIARGGSPFVGGKDHLTHHLVHIGVPEAGVPLLLGAISLISGGLTILVYKLIPEWSEF